MAINKNFVVKNGIEVNTSLIVADTTLNKVGVGTTVPGYTLHVGGSRGGIGATDITITGIATVGTSGSTSAALSVVGVSSFQGDVNFLGSAGVSTITFDASLDKLNFADNARATFGASDDLQIFHDGSNSIIRETGTGNIVLEGSGETLAVFADDGAVSLYYDNANVFQTTPQGINVTGVATALRLNVAGVATVGSLSIGSTEIVDTSFQLKNIESLDATTTATIETAIASGPNTFDDLKVTGITTLGFTTATTIEVGNEGLTVAGVTTQSGDLVVGVSTLFADVSSGRIGIGTAVPASTLDVDGALTVNSAKVEDLTNNRVVIAGTDGELEDSSNLTFDGSTLAVTGDETVSGKVSVGSGVTAFANGNLAVAGISTFNGNVLVGTGITIQPHGGVSIAGIVTVGGDLNVVGDITYDEIGGRNINITGFSTFGNDLNVGLTTFFVDVSNGGVGVGTDNPNPNGYGPQFKVFGNNPVLALEDDGGGVNAFGFVRQNSNTLQIVTGDNSDNKIQISKTSDTSSSWTGSNLTNVVTIDQGNIGVGIATATLRDSAKLDVDGGARFSGSVIVKDGGNAGAGVTIFDNGNIVASGIVTATEFSGPFSGSTGSFSGDLSIADKIVHIGDTNTAIRFPAADTFTVETAGDETFRITGVGGSIGINETTPDSKVDIVHSTAENSSTENLIHLRTDPSGGYVTRGLFVKIGRDGQYDNSAAHYDIVGSAGNSGFHAFEVQGDEKLRITKDSQVAIGTATIYANANCDDLIVGNRNSNEQGITIGAKNQGQIAFADLAGDRQGLIHYQHTDDSMRFMTNGAINERVRITSAGLVGINTTPGTLLELKGESSKEADVTFNRQPVQGTNDGVIGQLLFENNTDSVAQISVKRESAADDAYIQVATQATGGGVTERLRITSGGDVKVSTAATIFANGNATFSGISTFGGTSHVRIPVGTTAQRDSNAVNGDIRYNTTLNSYEGYGNGAWGGLGGGTEIDVSVSSTSATNLTTFAHASYRSASMRIQITQGSSYQVGKYLLIHDGTTVTIVEEAAIATGDMLGSISGTINGSNVEVKVTMNSASSATVTTIIDKITV